MRQISVDIETYSDVDIKKAGAYKYALSPNFEILLIAWAVEDGPVQCIDLKAPEPDRAGLTAFMDDLRAGDVCVRAYNAAFEWWGLSQYMPRLGWTLDAQELLGRMRCTMAQAYYCGFSGALGVVGEAVGIPQDKRKLGVGGSLIRTFCTPQKPTKANGGRTRVLPAHEPEKWELFKRYNVQDVEAEREIARRLAPWPLPEREQALWGLNCLTNARGVLVDGALVDGALRIGETVQTELLDEARAISGLENPRSVRQLLDWLREELDDDLPDLRKATVSDMLERGVDSERAARMLAIRRQTGKTSTKKYDAMRAAVCEDGRVRGLLQYYGASRTGRWAGRLVQVQNLPRNDLPTLAFARELTREGRLDALRLMYADVPDTLSQLIRTAFIPAPGSWYLVADFSAIEARVIAWLAGETWRMEVFEQGGDIYCASASQMFGVPVEKHGVNGHLRQKGKVAELALGYGGGSGALIAMGALKMGLAEDELPDIVDRWRRSSPRIVALWADLERAAVRCVRDCIPAQTHSLRFQRELDPQTGLDFLTVALPAGRKLFYAKPYIAPNRFGKDAVWFSGMGKETKKWSAVSTWGGTLAENVTQAIARDCLAEVLLRLETAGYPVAFHVHDEVIVECPEDKLGDVLALMAAPIPWAPGLTLRGDGFSTQDYYRKE